MDQTMSWRFYKLAVAIVFLYIFFSATVAQAALLYFDPSIKEVYRGDTVTVDLRIDTDEGECINTVDAVVAYDPTIRAVDVSRGDSILNLWVEDPHINETDHTITLAGGLPGGYCGRIAGDPSLTNVVAQFVFRSPGFNIGGGDNPTARIWLTDASQVLLHDGLGTQAPLRKEEAVLTLLATAGTTNTDEWKNRIGDDATPPADFVITLASTTDSFSGKYFIAFNSQDKQSGIDHYEVIEEPLADIYAFKWGRADAPWVTTESPYVLQDQSLNSTIRVKAVDKAGNEIISVLVPDPALRSLSHARFVTIGIVVGSSVVALLAVLFIIIRLRNRQKNKQDTYVD